MALGCGATDPVAGLVGGALIGLAAAWMLLMGGVVMGCSGKFRGQIGGLQEGFTGFRRASGRLLWDDKQ